MRRKIHQREIKQKERTKSSDINEAKEKDKKKKDKKMRNDCQDFPAELNGIGKNNGIMNYIKSRRIKH